MNPSRRWSMSWILVLWAASAPCTPSTRPFSGTGTGGDGEGGGAAGVGGASIGGSGASSGGTWGTGGEREQADGGSDLGLDAARPTDGIPRDAGAAPVDAGALLDAAAANGDQVVCVRRMPVSSVAALSAAIQAAVPGDCVVLASGSYTASAPIVVDRAGTASRRITIMAETVGGATLAGAAGFAVNAPAAFVTIRGFRLTNSGGLVVAPNTQNVLITRNAFEVPGSGNYLVLGGTDNEASFNAFTNKATNGAMLVLDEDTKGTLRPFVHDNHFLSHTYDGANGGEAIRVFAILPRVEHNLLEEIHVHGEIISVKEGGGSRGGSYRFNTFRNCTNGTFTLRYARNDVIEGNFFFKTPGIRAYGTNHKIINNYLEGGRIELGDGTVGVGYVGLDNVEISFNTLIDAPITGQSRPGGVAPRNLHIANNILVGTTGQAFGQPTPFVNTTFEGNIVWGGVSSGDIPVGGFRQIDPRLVMDMDGRYRLGPGSPAIDSAVGPAVVSDDIEGQPRQQPDVGADELSMYPVLRRPLTPRDVGPNAP
jgi:Chondroitinase B